MLRKYQAVFTSRWKALWWAAGVCLTAYCTVPSQDQTEQGQAKLHPAHVSPWAFAKKS
jgi:hypothetical protein